MIQVQNLSSVGIIHRASNPREIFIETKTPGYPRKVFVGRGLLPGGNWIGKAATDDDGPFETYCREIDEELSFGNSTVDPNEMIELFDSHTLGHPPEVRSIQATPEDNALLESIKDDIVANTDPLGVYLQYVPKAVFDSADPENKAGDYHGAVSVFEVSLPDDIWLSLVALQERYGNLSNESQTLVTSVVQLADKGWQIGWGQDRILQEFFLKQGFEEAKRMSLMDGITAVRHCDVMGTYDEYLRVFEVEKIPEGITRPTLS